MLVYSWTAKGESGVDFKKLEENLIPV